MNANQIIQTPLDQVPDNDICSLHGKPITKLCTHDNRNTLGIERNGYLFAASSSISGIYFSSLKQLLQIYQSQQPVQDTFCQPIEQDLKDQTYQSFNIEMRTNVLPHLHNELSLFNLYNNMFLCQSCCELDQHREHMFKSISFLAEEISESLRVKMAANERTLDQFSHILRDLQEKFKKSNIRSQLSLIVEMIKGIVKHQMEKSQVIEDCGVLLEAFRGKVEKMGQMKKRVKQGDKACIEVLQQRKEMEEIIQSLGQERMLKEYVRKHIISPV